MVKLQMNKGTDSIGHDQVNYIVDPFTWQVDVPPHVAATLLATGAGAVLVSDDPQEETFAPMRHRSNPLQSLASQGRSFHPEDGVIHVPRAAVIDALRAGFTLVEV